MPHAPAPAAPATARAQPPGANAALVLADGAIFWGRGVGAIADSFSIRRTALVRNVPYYTTITAAGAVVDALRALETGHLEVAPLQVYFKAST